jgi:hypothetical protein
MFAIPNRRPVVEVHEEQLPIPCPESSQFRVSTYVTRLTIEDESDCPIPSIVLPNFCCHKLATLKVGAIVVGNLVGLPVNFNSVGLEVG